MSATSIDESRGLGNTFAATRAARLLDGVFPGVLALLMGFALGATSCTAARAEGPLPVRASVPQTTESELTPAGIHNAMTAKTADFAECVATHGGANRGSGSLLLVFDVTPNGEAANIGVRAPEQADLEISHCMARVVATCEFPRSTTGAQGITYPFKY